MKNWQFKNYFALSAMVAISTVLTVNATEEKSIVTKDVSLELIMSDPDWIGNAPESAYFSDDGMHIFYRQKKIGNKERQLFKLNIATKQSVAVTDKELFSVDNTGVISQDGKYKAYNSQGDLWLKVLATGELKQLTRTHTNEGTPQFIGNSTIAYRQSEDFYSIDLDSGLVSQLVDIRLETKPNPEPAGDFLKQQQSRYFDYIKKQQEQEQHNANRKQVIAASSNLDPNAPWYIGKDVEIHTASLSPNGRYLLLGTYKKSKQKAKPDNMPHFVTEDGYVRNEEVRALVGTAKPRNETLYLLDLQTHEKSLLDYSSLPDIDNDPLASIKKKTAKRNNKKYKPHKGNRGVAVFDWVANRGVSWSKDGKQVAVMLYSDDNKDRWIVRINTADKELESLNHLHDKAWVNDWDFNDFGWLDNKTIYYTSEESGYSQLYKVFSSGRGKKALTKGRFIVNNVLPSADKKYLYYRANKKHPGIYEVYRFNTSSGKNEVVTDLGGLNNYKLSLDGQQILIEHSESDKPMNLYVSSTEAGVARFGKNLSQLTNTISKQFNDINWVKPRFIEVASSEADQPIYARLYTPEGFDEKRLNKYPAVMFIHGAGYLQNSHQGWSGYFREFMFHTFLTQQGYIVLDMDYRASKGYGRDWRTAIYRNMGTPEVVDLRDGAQWLADNMNVDRNKIGIYGGSYGGFLTFMALFTAPDDFAAGASLRPVTDWAHYNHGYTSNILNTPEVDPEAFERSSPIEFAEGLNKPLLIAHGMVDDNVFFKDTVRLVQRLIELEKTQYFETAIYPIEAHGFTEPSSWLDEYKRIYYLFEQHLK